MGHEKMLVQQVDRGLAPPQGSWTVWLPKLRAGRAARVGACLTKGTKSIGFLICPTLWVGEVGSGQKLPFIYGVHGHWVESEFLGQP